MTAGLVLALSLLFVAPPRGVLVDRIDVVVDKDVITESELMTETRVALAWRTGEEAATAELNKELLAAMRDYVINQTLVANQARRLGSTDVADEEVDRRLWQFTQRFASSNRYRAFLRRFGIAESTVQNILRRELRNDLYIQQRLRTRILTTRPGETNEQRYAEALESWLAELRQGVEIRIVGPGGELEQQNRR